MKYGQSKCISSPIRFFLHLPYFLNRTSGILWKPIAGDGLLENLENLVAAILQVLVNFFRDFFVFKLSVPNLPRGRGRSLGQSPKNYTFFWTTPLSDKWLVASGKCLQVASGKWPMTSKKWLVINDKLQVTSEYWQLNIDKWIVTSG